MFSARLGFMRPDSVTEPDGPVLPPDDPNYAGNLYFVTRHTGNSYGTSANEMGATKMPSAVTGEYLPFNNQIYNNWLILSTVLPPFGTVGFTRINGLDTTDHWNLRAPQLPQGQLQLKTFCMGMFETGTMATNPGQMGQPMVVRDWFMTDDAMTLSDVEKIEGWMCHGVGLQNILQTDHPYKSSPASGFTPSDLSPRSWWNADQGVNNTLSTWSTVDGAHTLVRSGASPGSTTSELIEATTEDGINVINFPNSKTVQTSDASTGVKYRADSATSPDMTARGITIVTLIKFKDIPGVFDQNNQTPGGGTKHLASFFTLNVNSSSSANRNSYIAGSARPDAEQVTRVSTDSSSDPDPDSGNSDVDVANVTTDGGNVSV